MLINASRLLNYPILSLHMGGPVAWVYSEVVDPEKMKIVAFCVDGPAIKNDPEVGNIMEASDVREFSDLGMIVDSADDFVNEGEVKRLDKVLALNFSLYGLKVVTKKGTKLGKIVDFVVDTDNYMVHQLVVKRPIVKAFLDPELIIPRKEILEIDDYQIVVKDEEEKIRKRAAREDFVPNFVNPFREPDFSTSRIEKTRKTDG